MHLHIVGGFLGSGKTTAIIGAAKHLMAQGQRVGVVTNDQGRYLVDTAFFRLSAVPTVEVTGGCFCCNYDDLDARLAQLKDTAQPNVIFAESVGSCADVVATVVRPLLVLRAGDVTPESFSVFSDARLLRRRLLGQAMPFSDDVVYLFDKQIEEAGLLVINKADLLSPDAAQATLTLARERYPGKAMRLQNSLEAASVAAWTEQLARGAASPPAATLEIDYGRYGGGEARLAWLDERITLAVPEGQGRPTVIHLIGEIVAALREQNLAVGHLKFWVEGAAESAKVSFPTLETQGWEQALPAFGGKQITVLVNARVETSADALRAWIAGAVARTANATGAALSESDVAAFHPAFPNPQHRVG